MDFVLDAADMLEPIGDEPLVEVSSCAAEAIDIRDVLAGSPAALPLGMKA